MKIVLILIFILGIFLVIFYWWRDQRYLKQKVTEVMSDSVWKEIEEERRKNLSQRNKFREILKKIENKK